MIAGFKTIEKINKETKISGKVKAFLKFKFLFLIIFKNRPQTNYTNDLQLQFRNSGREFSI